MRFDGEDITGLPPRTIARKGISRSFQLINLFNDYTALENILVALPELTTFRRVTLPTIMPGVLSGAMLAFTLSLDDYVITYFTAGPGSTTLPLRVFSIVRFMLTTEVNALSTIWVLAVFLVLLVGRLAQNRRA